MLSSSEACVVDRSTLEVDGVRSLVLQAGPPEASEAVVFVHGNPGSSEDWAGVLSEAGRFARAVAPDMPGFGRADKPEDFEYTVEGYGRHLGRVLQELGIRRAHLVLHDFGGPWGLSWAADRPQAVASVTLVDTGILPGYQWHLAARIWRTPLLGEACMAALTRRNFHFLQRHSGPNGLPRPFVDHMYDDFDRGTRRAVLRLYRSTSNPTALSASLSERLGPLNLPALVIWGRQDGYVPVRFAEAQHAVFPQADIRIFERSGHWPFIDEPAAFSEALLPFLKRHTDGCG